MTRRVVITARFWRGGEDTLLWKCLASEDILQLAGKDVIAAEQTYIQEHLTKAGFSSSGRRRSQGAHQRLQELERTAAATCAEEPNRSTLTERPDIVLKLTVTPQGPRPVSTAQIDTEISEVPIEGGDGQEAGGKKAISMTHLTEKEDSDEVDLA